MSPKLHAPPQKRALLVGASNITIGLPWLVPAIEERLEAPVEIVGAWGHGRSYGKPSSLLYRTLRGIVHSKLWERLEDRPDLPTSALITDVGNDIAFGETPDDILEWVTTVFERLEAMGARTVVTGLPLERLRDQSKTNFFIIRVLFFPQYPLRQPDILAKVEEVNGRLEELCAKFGNTFVPAERDWYSYDPIHIRFRRQREAWEHILRAWSDDPAEVRRRVANPRRAMELYSMRPERYDIFAEKFLTIQPCYTTRQGSQISMY